MTTITKREPVRLPPNERVHPSMVSYGARHNALSLDDIENGEGLADADYMSETEEALRSLDPGDVDEPMRLDQVFHR